MMSFVLITSAGGRGSREKGVVSAKFLVGGGSQALMQSLRSGGLLFPFLQKLPYTYSFVSAILYRDVLKALSVHVEKCNSDLDAMI